MLSKYVMMKERMLWLGKFNQENDVKITQAKQFKPQNTFQNIIYTILSFNTFNLK